MKKHLLFTFIAFCFCTLLNAQVNVKQVKDINPGNGGSNPSTFAIANNKLFFIAYNGTDYELYVTEGTEATTTALGPTGAAGNSPTYPVAYKDKVYFTAKDNNHGQELWVSDGTVAGTKMFADLYTGTTGSFPQNLTVVNNKLIFIAANADGDRRLYATDGTLAGTVVIRNNYNDNFNGAPNFVTLNNTILFRGDDGSNTGYGLFISDGTAAGTALLKGDFNPVNSAGNSVQLNNKVYFSGDDNAHGIELWASDGTAAGTYLVKNISPDPGGGVYASSGPQGFCVYKNKVYFSANDGTHGQELWVTDGTEANTVMVKDVQPGSNGSLPYHSIVYNDKLYFITWGQYQLWVTDGTEANTREVAPVSESSQFAAIWNNTMYLESPSIAQVYQSDGTTAGTVLAKADNTTSLIDYSSPDYHFNVYKNELYFSGYIYGISNGYELVKLTTGTLPLTLLNFKGQVQKDEDVVKWQTATETNTAWFELQQATDGTVFTKTAIIAAAGNSSTIQNYSFSQKSIINPAGYYRLKMIDKNGDFSYSNIIQLARGGAGAVNAFYNNSSRQIIIQNTTTGACNWQLYSAGGSLVKKGTSESGSITIPASGMAGGVYILTCQSKTGSSKFTLPVF